MTFTQARRGGFDVRPIVSTLKWWIVTAAIAALAPFVLLGLVSWVAWFDGATLTDYHQFLVSLVSTAPPQAWAQGSRALTVLVAIPMAAAIVWRVLNTTLYVRMGEYIDAFLERSPRVRWALMILSTTVLAAFIVYAHLTSNAERTARPPVLPPMGFDAPIASAAIALPDGQVVSGVADIKQDGEHWMISFRKP